MKLGDCSDVFVCKAGNKIVGMCGGKSIFAISTMDNG